MLPLSLGGLLVGAGCALAAGLVHATRAIAHKGLVRERASRAPPRVLRCRLQLPQLLAVLWERRGEYLWTAARSLAA